MREQVGLSALRRRGIDRRSKFRLLRH
jgi:hypothetical protein